MNTSLENFGIKVREFRYLKNYSMTMLAEKLGCQWGTISRWENGIAKPSVEHYFAFMSLVESDPEARPVSKKSGRRVGT